MNTLSFLINCPNKVNTTSTIVGGYITVNIGAENCIILSTPKLDTTKLNKHTPVTITSYFTLLFDSLEKYCPVADVNPIAVVKHASVTIIPNTTFPGKPNNISVIERIKNSHTY